jgi:hypothetical protein
MEDAIFKDSDIIYSYTRKMAIEDGEQMQLDTALTKQAGFIYPVFLTSIVVNIINAATEKNKCQSFNGIVWDILTILKYTIKMSINTNDLEVVVKINGKNYTFYSQIGATDIDNAAPAITIMDEQDL